MSGLLAPIAGMLAGSAAAGPGGARHMATTPVEPWVKKGVGYAVIAAWPSGLQLARPLTLRQSTWYTPLFSTHWDSGYLRGSPDAWIPFFFLWDKGAGRAAEFLGQMLVRPIPVEGVYRVRILGNLRSWATAPPDFMGALRWWFYAPLGIDPDGRNVPFDPNKDQGSDAALDARVRRLTRTPVPVSAEQIDKMRVPLSALRALIAKDWAPLAAEVDRREREVSLHYRDSIAQSNAEKRATYWRKKLFLLENSLDQVIETYFREVDRVLHPDSPEISRKELAFHDDELTLEPFFFTEQGGYVSLGFESHREPSMEAPSEWLLYPMPRATGQLWLPMARSAPPWHASGHTQPVAHVGHENIGQGDWIDGAIARQIFAPEDDFDAIIDRSIAWPAVENMSFVTTYPDLGEPYPALLPHNEFRDWIGLDP